jgi:Lhr-like helicase
MILIYNSMKNKKNTKHNSQNNSILKDIKERLLKGKIKKKIQNTRLLTIFYRCCYNDLLFLLNKGTVK